MASVIQKYMHAFRAFGWKETLIKMYTVGVAGFVKRALHAFGAVSPSMHGNVLSMTQTIARYAGCRWGR